MSSAPARLPRPLRCGATTSLTAIEAAKLRVVCYQVPAADALLSCEIAIGHDSSHLAFATTASDGDLWWWLYWKERTREVRQVDLCDGRLLDDPYPDDCLLPDGHPGPHSFELHDG
jgi:hypothetical protein